MIKPVSQKKHRVVILNMRDYVEGSKVALLHPY